MSWFTAEAKSASPVCPRCRKPNFVRLVKSGELHDLYDCTSCPTPKQKSEGGKT